MTRFQFFFHGWTSKTVKADTLEAALTKAGLSIDEVDFWYED